jgi:2-polyprenyl-3-methyl-5-hydroxy-6-metoxy-1,4-benzoquinol methylase
VTTRLHHPEGEILIEELAEDRRRVSAVMSDPGAEPARDTWDTAYPADLIASVLEVKGPAWVCDEIMREEDAGYVERSVRLAVLGYVDEGAFAGKRVLDLGSGCGSSSLVLARLLPDTEIVGVELVAEFVELARERAAFRRAGHLRFEHSPDGTSIPDGLGDFDFIVLSAVYEHLLPSERQSLLPLLWSRLNPGGVLFINQLPHRFSPIEGHTTGLPLINYLPPRIARRLAISVSPRSEGEETWEQLLRRGIRGGTPSEILRIVSQHSGVPELLEPTRFGMHDRIDLWFALSMGSRLTGVKRAIKAALKALKRVTGVTFVPELSLAIERERSGS